MNRKRRRGRREREGREDFIGLLRFLPLKTQFFVNQLHLVDFAMWSFSTNTVPLYLFCIICFTYIDI
ncbi:MAG TPA: hypothetical protein DCY88_31180 [Cyanobacteria bacterium UBA11372]|nr:hypothetical protein [Cyanobacteria bacterium UBA11372]